MWKQRADPDIDTVFSHILIKKCNTNFVQKNMSYNIIQKWKLIDWILFRGENWDISLQAT